MYGIYSDPEWKLEEWYYKGFPRKEDKQYYITTIGISIPNHIKRQKYEILTRNSMQIKIKKLSPTAITPTKAHITDAGYDLYSDEDVCVGPGERKLIKTGISFEIPNGYVGLIWPRSGLSYKKGIDVLGGVIDSGFLDSVEIGRAHV